VKRLLPVLALGLLVGAFFVFRGEGFQNFWERWLVVSAPMERADALIVLGGEPQARPTEAARLYRAGVAPKVFVTGIGDSSRNRQFLIAEGVPQDSFTVEPKSTTPFANATLLKPLLAGAQVRRALIVTSPFHTRRALGTFRKVMPEITFGVTDTSIGWWKRPGEIGRASCRERG